MDLVREHYDGTQRPANVTLTPQWDEQCPPLLKEAITGQLPAVIDRAAYNRVVAWRPTAGGKGLFVLGPSGTGKTTALWALARELEREGCAPLILTGVELGRQLSQAARDISSVEHLWRCRVLMIDDLGKEKSTPAMAALFWEVLDKRYLHQRPLVFTSRFDGDAMRVRFGEECLGDDIRRRINELCRGVRFTIAAPSGKISDP
jgi:DNA replication protein DnaC